MRVSRQLVFMWYYFGSKLCMFSLLCSQYDACRHLCIVKMCCMMDDKGTQLSKYIMAVVYTCV